MHHARGGRHEGRHVAERGPRDDGGPVLLRGGAVPGPHRGGQLLVREMHSLLIVDLARPVSREDLQE